jgi:hypothetical protein
MADGTLNYSRRSPGHPRAARDFYVEPEWSVDLLLQNERFIGDVWDPCAGSATIVRACKRAGITVNGSDLVSHDPMLVNGGIDFLLVDRPYQGAQQPMNIVFNPPYGEAQKFILRALSIVRCKVAAIVQQQFPYSLERHALFRDYPPARVYFLSSRPSMPPGEAYLAGTIKARGGKTDYLWMVWDHDHHAKIPTTAFWLKRDVRSQQTLERRS